MQPGVNFHINQWIPTDTVIKDPGCGTFQLAPKGYALKAFDLGGHGSVRPVTITSNPDAVNLTAYASVEPGNPSRHPDQQEPG